jgi:hypothetical protein
MYLVSLIHLFFLVNILIEIVPLFHSKNKEPPLKSKSWMYFVWKSHRERETGLWLLGGKYIEFLIHPKLIRLTMAILVYIHLFQQHHIIILSMIFIVAILASSTYDGKKRSKLNRSSLKISLPTTLRITKLGPISKKPIKKKRILTGSMIAIRELSGYHAIP